MSLNIPAVEFYNGVKLFNKRAASLDASGKELILEACRRQEIKNALKQNWHRRTYTDDSVTRKDGKMMLASFDQIGPRQVNDCDMIIRIGHTGWYTDSDAQESLIGVVVCLTRHGANAYGNGSGRGRKIYMAGTRHSDWDGVTLDLRVTDNPETAARWADKMAEREAESCCKADDLFQRENQAENVRDRIKTIRTECLLLLRDLRPIRKSIRGLPESIYDALHDVISNYTQQIAKLRLELPNCDWNCQTATGIETPEGRNGMKHKPIREGDEVYCTRCKKRWDVREEAPKCDISARREYLKFINQKFLLTLKGTK